VAQTIAAIKRRDPEMLVEALVGDFQGNREQVDGVLRGRPDVFAHNVETVLRLTPRVRDHRCSYVRSMEVLRTAKELLPGVVTKSSLMLGLGESDREVEQAMDDLREHGVDVVTFGQYLRPTIKHLPVREHVTPARFAALEQRAMTKGFLYVASGPLVRSSYKAAEYYLAGMIRQRRELEAARAAAGTRSSGTPATELS
jgi:lipoic acid synthetase